MTTRALPYEAKFRWDQQNPVDHWEPASPDPDAPPIVVKTREEARPGDALTLKEIEVHNVPGEGANPFHQMAAAYSGFIKAEVGKGIKSLRSRPTKLAANTSNTLQLDADDFVCLDAGSWLNQHQNFSLISKDAVFLCNYDPNGAAAVVAGAKGPAGEFFAKVPGCSVARGPIKVNFRGTGMRDDEMYVVIPDMHIPQTADSRESQRTRYRLWEKLAEQVFQPSEWRRGIDDLARAAYRQARRDAGEFGEARNFLRGLTGINAMTAFLDSIRKYFETTTTARKLTLLQVGDMYELWAYRPCHFEDSGDAVAEPLVVNRPNIVAEWIAGTHFLFHDMFAAFDRCKESGVRLVFVHGNHDCYLVDKKVRDFANTWLSDLAGFAKSCDLGNEFASVGFLQSRVHDRMACFNENGIHAEHAHNHFDVSNHDGAASGQSFTDFGAKIGDLSKQFDSLRRGSFVAGAASVYFGKPFRIYVMGHTHGMDLNHVRVTHWLDRKNVNVVPQEGP